MTAAGLYITCYYLGGTAAGVVPGAFWALGKWPACVGFFGRHANGGAHHCAHCLANPESTFGNTENRSHDRRVNAIAREPWRPARS